MLTSSMVGLVAVFLAGADENSLPVSRMRDWEIVVAADAIPSERYAAEEFRGFFAQATGIEPAVTSKPRRRKGLIYIGSSEAFRRSRLGFDTDGFGEEEFRIRVGRRGIAIVGGRPRGTLYGVYQFLEDCLGGRFLTADHTHVPRNVELRIPLLDVRYTPPFVYRWSYCKEASACPEFAARLRLNTITPDERLGGVTRETMDSHTLYRQVPVTQYGQSHPEYFAWVDGERLLDAPGGGPQVCPLNPRVVDIVAQAVLDELASRPGAPNASVSVNDNPFYCHCPACEALNEREGTPAAAHLSLVNAVAERLEARYPGVKIATLAYNYTRKPPRFLRPRGNVQVWFCAFEACGLHRLDDPACPRNPGVLADLDGWLAVCRDVRFWCYNTNLRTLDLPYPNLRSLGPNLRILRGKGVRGAFMQADGKCFAGEFADLRSYVTSRLLWNPGLDADAVVEEFLQLHYGPAADSVRAAIDLIHDGAEGSGAHPYCWIEPVGAGITREDAPRLLALFEEAAKRASDEIIKGRVEKISLGAYKALFETQGRLVYAGGSVRLEYPPGIAELVPRYRELCERFGMTFDSEFWSRDDFLDSLRNMVAGSPATRIEDGTWRLTLVPAFNGEMVDLFHRPTGRQLLDAWDRPNINLPSGTWGELARKGLESAPMSFTCTSGPRSAGLVKRTNDGSEVRRTVRLRDGKVEFETSIRQVTAGRVYALNAAGDFRVGAPSVTGNRLDAWDSHSAFGIRLRYDLGQFKACDAETEPGLHGLHVELSTPSFRLEKGGLWRARYNIECLLKPPIDLASPE